MITSSQPRVGVVIPCYNHARDLAEAVGSVAGQNFGDWEAIVVDDGSTDDTTLVAEQLIAAYPGRSIRLLRQPNGGPGASRNAGIAATCATYILPLDADDILEPEMLVETVRVLDAHPEVGFVYSDGRMFGEETGVWSGGDYSLDLLRFDSQLLSASLFRRQAWEDVGGFQPDVAYEDWDFWLRLAEAGWQGWRIALPLMRYRRISGSRHAANRTRDLVMRAQIMLNHPRLYEPALLNWAGMVCSPAYSEAGAFRSAGHWLRAFASYTALIARYHPQLLPKTLLREVFARLPTRQQGHARRLARLLGMSQGG